MRSGIIALAIALCGCTARLSNGLDPTLGTIDSVPDAATDPTGDASTTEACARRTVYLNFEGQTLTRGPSDATANQARWMNKDTGTAPAYQATNTNRAAVIKTIFDGVRAQLAQFPINVTTSRPTSGDYVMIVLGGRARSIGSDFGGAVNELDCGDATPNDVAWVSENVQPEQAVINTVIGAIGFGLGLTATNEPRDCMCSWANGCIPDDSVPCRLGSPIDRDPMARQTCPDGATQDEVAVFRAAFCR